MKAFPLGFDPPGARRYVSTLQTRSAELLADILCEHQLRGAARYRKRDVDGKPGDETFCNVHSCDVAEAMGVFLPRGLRANALAGEWLPSKTAGELGWEEVSGHVAQRMADEGQLAFATCLGITGPGHIAPLEPSLGEEGIWLSNIGATNGLRMSLAQVFGQRLVRIFAHP